MRILASLAIRGIEKARRELMKLGGQQWCLVVKKGLYDDKVSIHGTGKVMTFAQAKRVRTKANGMVDPGDRSFPTFFVVMVQYI